MEMTFAIEGLPELAQRLDSIAVVVAGPIARHGLEAGGDVIAEQARANVHKLTGLLAGDVVVVVRVHQDAGESYALIGPGWDPEAFRRTRQRRGRWANEAPSPDQTTNPGLYGKFLETGHRDAGEGLAHNLEYQRARRRAHGAINTAEFGSLTTPPYPWLAPALDERGEQALEVCAETMREDLEGLNL
jgi:HK97 gp10 family phage protein